MLHGGYSITVSAPVCGTGSSGSIPGSRPRRKFDTLITMSGVDIVGGAIIAFAIGAGLGYYIAPLIFSV